LLDYFAFLEKFSAAGISDPGSNVFNLEGMPSDAGERLEAYMVLAALRALVARLENIETFVCDMLCG
jgi:hypothetical protein